MTHTVTSLLIVALGIVAAAVVRTPAAVPEESPTTPLTVFLVRHAEKAEDSRDPELSRPGHARAAELAVLLGDRGIEHVHSTDFIRTRDTAGPVAATLGVELYDPSDLPAFAARLGRDGGRHLVVGHSNTTPPLVELLGGKPRCADRRGW